MNITKEDIAIMRIIRTQNVGYAIYHQLMKLGKNPINALNILECIVKKEKKSIKGIKNICSELDVLEELEKTHDASGSIITHINNDYPAILKSSEYPLPYIITKGNANILSETNIGIVGSRKPLISSQSICKEIAIDLAQQYEYNIVSGLAIGIDSKSHEYIDDKKCIAAIPCHIKACYPASSEKKMKSIYENGGCLVSLEPITGKMDVASFRKRNLLLASLSAGLVIIQCAKKSGSLMTAKMALENNRELMVVPGNAQDYRFSGSHELIQSGAHLVTSSINIHNIVSSTRVIDQFHLKECQISFSEEYNQYDCEKDINCSDTNINDIKNYISYEGISIDELSVITKIENHRRILIMLIKIILTDNNFAMHNNIAYRVKK